MLGAGVQGVSGKVGLQEWLNGVSVEDLRLEGRGGTCVDNGGAGGGAVRRAVVREEGVRGRGQAGVLHRGVAR